MAAHRTLAPIALATALLPGAALAQGPTGTPVDLSHPFDETTLYWPAGSFRAAEHGGTHLDAPVHFAEGRRSVDGRGTGGPLRIVGFVPEARDEP